MSRCWSVQPWLTCRWKGRPQHQKRTSLRVRTMNLNASRALIMCHNVSPRRAIILHALGLQGQNGLKTLEPRGGGKDQLWVQGANQYLSRRVLQDGCSIS